jgi:hypothetical protein
LKKAKKAPSRKPDSQPDSQPEGHHKHSNDDGAASDGTVDWRGVYATTTVASQGYCGACWSFSTAEQVNPCLIRFVVTRGRWVSLCVFCLHARCHPTSLISHAVFIWFTVVAVVCGEFL